MFPIFAEASSALPVATIVMSLFGGLALFLYGIDLMSDSLKLVAGDGLRTVLARLTTNRFTGVLAGATVTAIIQSSSVTTVLVVGFISAGLMNLTQAIGVIMGANIGTTITAQIIAFKVTHFALAFIALGFFLQFVFKNNRVRQSGLIILGLGLIFFGMGLMSSGMNPLRSYPPFIDLMIKMEAPWMAILYGALFIVIVLAGQGFLSLPAGIALIFGANIGTCVTASLASLGKPREAKRAVLVHILFNVLGVALWYFFIPNLADFTVRISPHSGELDPAMRLAAETPRQIANAHAIFNVANTLFFIGLVSPMAWLVLKVLPEQPAVLKESATPKYLDHLLLETPPLALDLVRLELGRLGAKVLKLTRRSLHTVIRGSQTDLLALREANRDITTLHSAIIAYLGDLSRDNLNEPQSQQLHRHLSEANYLVNIGDMVDVSLVEAGLQRSRANLHISRETEEILSNFHHEICLGLDRAIRSLVNRDPVIASEVTEAKATIEDLASKADFHLSRRLLSDQPNRLIAFRLESELIEYLKRIFYFAKRIAKLAHYEQVPPEEIAPKALTQTPAPARPPSTPTSAS